MFKDFKEFVIQGNVIDLAIGIVIGAAFGTVVKSFVDDILMPPIGLLLGGVDFTDLFAVLKEGATAGPYATLAAARAAGAVTINFGVFFNAVISFLIVAFAVFLVIRAVNRARRPAPAAPAIRECPYCATSIPLKASRCPQCTSQLVAER